MSVALRPDLTKGLSLLHRHFQLVLVLNTSRRVSKAILEALKSRVDRGLNAFDAIYIFRGKETVSQEVERCQRPFYFNRDEFSAFK